MLAGIMQTYMVLGLAVVVDGVRHERGATFTAELTAAQRWLLRKGHITIVESGDTSESDDSEEAGE